MVGLINFISVSIIEVMLTSISIDTILTSVTCVIIKESTHAPLTCNMYGLQLILGRAGWPKVQSITSTRLVTKFWSSVCFQVHFVSITVGGAFVGYEMNFPPLPPTATELASFTMASNAFIRYNVRPCRRPLDYVNIFHCTSVWFWLND